jgi:HAD superfamily hydrolase (TIGR01549 family)
MDADPDQLETIAAPLAIVFDVGEVLIDETRVWSIWADMVGVSPLTFAAVLGAAIVQGEDWPAVFPHVAPNVAWQELEAEHERRYGGFQDSDLYADVRHCLAALQQLDVRVIIAGNQPARRRAQLEALELPVDALATSEDLGVEKPKAGFWSAVSELCGDIPTSQVLYVGDRVDNDIEPATEAGFLTCWLQRGPWGQLQDLPDGLTPDLVLEGLGELPQIIANWAQQNDPATQTETTP